MRRADAVRLLGAIGILACFSAQAIAQAPLRKTPADYFNLTNSIQGGSNWARLIAWNVRAGAGELSFLVQSKQTGRFSIARVDAAGHLKSFVQLPGIEAQGLAVNGSETATLIVQKNRTRQIVRYGGQGTLKDAVDAPCLSQFLFILNNQMTSVCPDGAIVWHSASGEKRTPSVALRGTVAEPMDADRWLVIDPVAGQLMVNDIHAGSVTPLPRIADVQEKLAMADSAVTQIQAHSKVNLIRPVVILDIAPANDSFYLLLSPTHATNGATVVKINVTGNVIGRWQCLPPDPSLDNIHKVAVIGGTLFLVTVNGNVVAYDL